jgi:hypothetical protein
VSSCRRRLPPLPRFLLPHEYTEHQRIHPIYLLVPFVLIVSRLAFVGGDLHGCSLSFDTVAMWRASERCSAKCVAESKPMLASSVNNPKKRRRT